jgi:hypothetical protein
LAVPGALFAVEDMNNFSPSSRAWYEISDNVRFARIDPELVLEERKVDVWNAPHVLSPWQQTNKTKKDLSLVLSFKHDRIVQNMACTLNAECG